jgi:hypothetical protein
MGVDRRQVGRLTSGWKHEDPGDSWLEEPVSLECKRTEDHSNELFGARAIANRVSGGEGTEGRARVGPKPGRPTDGHSKPMAWVKGEHHVRTVYGEGTARDFLRAV